MNRSNLLAVLLPALLIACAGLRPTRPDVAKYKAEEDFGCKQVEVTEQEAVGARSVFTATGCTKTGVYVVHCPGAAVCQAYSEAEWAKKSARLNASSVTYSVENGCRDTVFLNDSGNGRKFSLAPGGRELLVGATGDNLQLIDDAGNVLHQLIIKEEDRNVRVTNACVTLAY